MHVAYHPFWLPKAGNSEDEYEDAFNPARYDVIDVSGNALRVAIADGATETLFAKLWAELITKAYVEGKFDLSGQTLPFLCQEWNEFVLSKPLPWYAEEKARSGAFAALLGFSIQSNNEEDCAVGSWDALAIGDSCLFQVRRDELVVAFPLTHSTEFNRRPFLLSSLSSWNEVQEEFQSKSGEVEEGDTFYIMTDALACWFLEEREHGNHPWGQLHGLDENGSALPFDELVARLRKPRQLRNDDVTLLRIDVLSNNPYGMADCTGL